MKSPALAAALAVVATLATAGTAQAAEGAAQPSGKIYIGGKLAVADPDIGGGFDNAYTAGVYGGYNLFGRDAHYAANLGGGTLAVEGELMLTTSKGDTARNGKWDISSLAAYAAYRYPLGDKFYLKARMGLVRYDIGVTVEPPPAPTGAGTETKLAAGIGGGVKVGPGNIELDVTTYESDVLNYGVGFHMAFCSLNFF